MALKDCTFTVNVGGKAQVMDYDQLRLFLMKPKNMAAVAPTFAGQSGAGAPILMQADSPRRVTWPTVDMFPTVNELTEERLADVPKLS